MARILIVDDEAKIRHLLSIILERNGHLVDTAVDGAMALEKVIKGGIELIICDIKMPRLSGFDLIKEINQADVNCPVIFITAFATVESAVKALRLGAADYITKPFDESQIILSIEKTLNLARVMAENRDLKQRLVSASQKNDEIISVSEAMKTVMLLAQKAARSNSVVLIQGESGTGKELIARFIHHESERKDQRFVPINCAAISPSLVESELFGYEKGAFTGADRTSAGKFEYADRGTLFMDEIGDLSIDAQAKLLRALQEKKIRRVGGNVELNVDVRVVCATNQRLSDMVEKGKFREDLFYRINILPIDLPPLRHRREDIIPLAEHFLRKFSDGSSWEVTDGAARILKEYQWPGNVRELSNVMERTTILFAVNGKVTSNALSFLHSQQNFCIKDDERHFTLPASGVSLEKIQDDLVRQALEATGNNQTVAAKMLGLTRAKFRVLLKRLEG